METALSRYKVDDKLLQLKHLFCEIVTYPLSDWIKLAALLKTGAWLVLQRFLFKLSSQKLIGK